MLREKTCLQGYEQTVKGREQMPYLLGFLKQNETLAEALPAFQEAAKRTGVSILVCEESLDDTIYPMRNNVISEEGLLVVISAPEEALKPMVIEKIETGEHELFKTGDEGAPDCIKDINGDVVLGLCKKCGKAESELEGSCIELSNLEEKAPAPVDDVKIAHEGLLRTSTGTYVSVEYLDKYGW